jgi:hypothetical protein
MEQKYVLLVHNPGEARSFGMLAILAQKHIKLISYIVQRFCMMYG